ncbi:aspartate ammonia-lyase [Candidatus Formimonas warabiya]|uniref:aspartate ammonia-lyase n=2 Tax=Formimonas warabiya TaxID=1761012 RepID=A0A3G1L2F5_FORW1|nr:aspartate ammonia-lyase [Candidatus Formimonas warabiya]
MNSGETQVRMEKDALGEKGIPAHAYYGIHTARAVENFPVSGRKTNRHLIEALVLVKKAAAMAHRKLDHIPQAVVEAIITACDEILAGNCADQFVVDAFQGGAGTSTHMNVNEVVANRAIEILGGEKGDYTLVHPLHHVNCCQSTNDVYPTALRIAAIRLLRPLSEAFASLQQALQEKEHELADVIRLGRTQLMDALPMMAGQGFGAYAKAVARDRWRLYKVEERLREVNIGGTAIGTGMNASLKYTFLITDNLQEITGLGIARSEYPMDITQNMDVFVEVSGLLKAAAVNLTKISHDLRLLASGPAGGMGEVKLPPVQAGSSIMPGKVNPVIPEMVAQVSLRVTANDAAITGAAMNGQLELNAFTPLIAECLLESLELMTRAVQIFEERCIRGIEADPTRCREHVEKSSALATALVHHIGYEKAAEIAKKAQKSGKTVRQVAREEGILPLEVLDQILEPLQVTKPGIPGK